MKVSVVIASIGRSSLIRTLHSLEALALPENTVLHVVVGDDSEDGAVARRLLGFKTEHFELQILTVASRNIAICRNACLDVCRGDWVAFIDDDEWAEPSWLAKMLFVARERQVEAVFGRIITTYPQTVPDWFAKADPVGRMRRRSTGPVVTGSTGNAMVRRASILERDLRFDPRFGVTGGEDTDFFLRLGAQGGRFFFTNEAIVCEAVTLEKASVKFTLMRALRSGQSFAALITQQPGSSNRMLFYADALIKMLAGYSISIVLKPFNRSEAFIFRLKAMMNLGKLRHLMKRPLPELYSSEIIGE